MSVELKVPEVGESVTEVYIGKWYKAEGDEVDRDEQLVELESEKATLDLRAPAAGVLAKILKKTGDAADVGEVIGHLESNGAQAADKEKPAKEKGESSATKKPKPVEKKKPEQAENGPPEPDKEPRDDDTGAPVAKVERISPQATAEKAPAAAKTKRESRPEESPQAAPAKDSQQQPAEEAGGAGREAPGGRAEERVTMSPIRRRIATRLVDAQQQAALLTTFNEIDMTAVKELRTQFGESFEQRYEIRLGFMSFFVKAAIHALQQCPELNAMIDGDEIVYRRYYDIGVAISTDKGLVVPVLRGAQQMSFADIETAIEDFAKRARGGELKVDELQGGTFTITNGGVFGSLLSTPIVNPPQSGVLGMHAIQNRPVAVDDQVVIRPMMYVALTYDHRMVDGREAVTFLRRIKETIEHPARLLIDV